MQEATTEKQKQWFSLPEVEPELERERKEGFISGYTVGYQCLKDIYSVRPGGTTFIYSAPFTGKSRLWFQFMINISRERRLSHVIHSPETGFKKDVFKLLISMWGRKNYMLQSEEERVHNQEEVAKYFYVIDSGIEVITLGDTWKEVIDFEQKTGRKVFSLTNDPYNELDDMYSDRDRDKRLGKTLRYNRRMGRDLNVHSCIITHSKGEQRKELEFEDGRKHEVYMAATFRDIAEGEEWSRRGEFMLSVWRPRVLQTFDGEAIRMIDPSTGMPFPVNVMIVEVQKAKPDGYGKTGRAYLYYDINRYEYYEKIHTTNSYAWEYLGSTPF